MIVKAAFVVVIIIIVFFCFVLFGTNFFFTPYSMVSWFGFGSIQAYYYNNNLSFDRSLCVCVCFIFCLVFFLLLFFPIHILCSSSEEVLFCFAINEKTSAKQNAILFARHENALRISLETQKSNYQSHQLYEKMGFVKDDEFQTYHCFLK